MFKKFTIRAKLLTSLIAVAIVAAVIGLYGTFTVKTLDKDDTNLYEHYTVAFNYLCNIEADFQKSGIVYRDAIEENDVAKIDKLCDSLDKLVVNIEIDSKKYESTIQTQQGQQIFKDFTKSLEEYTINVETLKKLMKDNKDDEAKLLKADKLHETENKLEKSFDEMEENKVTVAKEISDGNTTAANSAS